MGSVSETTQRTFHEMMKTYRSRFVGKSVEIGDIDEVLPPSLRALVGLQSHNVVGAKVEELEQGGIEADDDGVHGGDPMQRKVYFCF